MSRGLEAFGAALTTVGKGIDVIDARREDQRRVNKQEEFQQKKLDFQQQGLDLQKKSVTNQKAFQEGMELAKAKDHWLNLVKVKIDAEQTNADTAMKEAYLALAQSMQSVQRKNLTKQTEQLQHILDTQLTPEQREELMQKRVAYSANLQLQGKMLMADMNQKWNNLQLSEDRKQQLKIAAASHLSAFFYLDREEGESAGAAVARGMKEFMSVMGDVEAQVESENVKDILKGGQKRGREITGQETVEDVRQAGIQENRTQDEVAGLTRAEEGPVPITPVPIPEEVKALEDTVRTGEPPTVDLDTAIRPGMEGVRQRIFSGAALEGLSRQEQHDFLSNAVDFNVITLAELRVIVKKLIDAGESAPLPGSNGPAGEAQNANVPFSQLVTPISAASP